MGFCVLTRVVATATVVAQVGKLNDIAVDETALSVDGGKYGAVALAVATRIADLNLSVRFVDRFTGRCIC